MVTDCTLPFFSNGYFAHVFSNSDLKHMPKTIMLVLDTSGSMTEATQACRQYNQYNKTCLTRIEQAKEAAVAVLKQLGEQDQFGILAFSSFANNFFERYDSSMSEARVLHYAKEDAIQDGIRFVSGMQASGGTNIFDSVMAGLRLVSPGGNHFVPEASRCNFTSAEDSLMNEPTSSAHPPPPAPMTDDNSNDVYLWLTSVTGLIMVVLIVTSSVLCSCHKPGIPAHQGMEMQSVPIQVSAALFGNDNIPPPQYQPLAASAPAAPAPPPTAPSLESTPTAQSNLAGYRIEPRPATLGYVQAESSHVPVAIAVGSHPVFQAAYSTLPTQPGMCTSAYK